MRTFKCASCKGVFESNTTEEEKVAELKSNFGEGHDTKDCDLVCDICYDQILKRYEFTTEE